MIKSDGSSKLIRRCKIIFFYTIDIAWPFTLNRGKRYQFHFMQGNGGYDSNFFHSHSTLITEVIRGYVGVR